MKREQFWAVENVETFRGHDVVNGEVDVSDDAYGDYIDEMYETVVIAGMSFNPSRIIQELDPIAWRCGKGQWEDELQSELENQLSCEDSEDIEFVDGDEDELDDEDSDTDYDFGYKSRINGGSLDENNSDDWVAGWYDADNNLKYEKDNPVK